jgi:hypothetical protein
MRQLIPRLLSRFKARSLASEKIRLLRPPAKGAKSLRKQLPPTPVFFGRSRSILLDDVNPIMHPRAYRRHKSLPPQVRLPDSQKGTRTVSRDGTVEDDVRREMTAEEREWWANPYRMSPPFPPVFESPADIHPSSNAIHANTEMCPVLAISPKWHVAFTYVLCPVRDRLTMYPDFLVRLSVKQFPSPRTGRSRSLYTFVPDGLQHPKFKGLDNRNGHYVVCRRAALQRFDHRGSTSLFHSLLAFQREPH